MKVKRMELNKYIPGDLVMTNGGVGMKQKCKYQDNEGWCKVRGEVCIWSEYNSEDCIKREEV